MHEVSQLIGLFIPEQYDLSLDMNRAGRTFSGVVTIHGSMSTATDKIVLHSKDLVIESATLDGKTAEYSLNENDELHLTRSGMTAGQHIAVIGFSGQITDSMHGLYPCRYEAEGEKRELLATQFESHHAREVFPCIDEPEAKAIFNLTLATEPGLIVLSNTPLKKQAEENQRLVSYFETTPRMSPYLLAWVVGDLTSIRTRSASGTTVSVWATKAHAPARLEFALNIAKKTIDFYEAYFDTPYPLAKCDHVALPDFSSGAMENWGLITYREIALLADEATSISGRQYIAKVIAHEVSHQWFGNLVTMKWWNDLWLNESFATLMEYVAIDSIHPEWRVWLDFAVSEGSFALNRDSLDGVQPVRVDISHPDEISTLFDGAIVYAKGARLLYMLQQMVGEDVFTNALSNYFKRFAYKNTDADDLWQEIEAASGQKISEFMHAWLDQPGFPVVHAAQSQGQLHISQERFFSVPHKPSDGLWPVPLHTSGQSSHELLTTRESAFAQPSDMTAFRLNIGFTAHFITNYDTALFNRILDELKNGRLAPIDRLQLIQEQLLLARGGVISNTQIVGLLQAYRGEKEEAVWDMISMGFGTLKKFVESDETAKKHHKALAVKLAGDLYHELGWQRLPNEAEERHKLRAGVISMMLYGKDPSAQKTALDIYRSQPLDKIDPELRTSILTTAVRHTDESGVVEKLIDLYRHETAAEIKDDLASAVTKTRDSQKVSWLLSLIPDTSTVRPQDAIYWVAWLMGNYDARPQAWRWLRDNWDWVETTYAGDKSYDTLPRYAANILSSRQEFEEYKLFFSPMIDNPALSRIIKIGFGEIEGRLNILERDADGVKQALANL